MIMRVHPQLDYLTRLSVTIGLQSIAGILLQSMKRGPGSLAWRPE